MSVDSGLYFDRNTHFKNTDYTQTLEPRVFYLYVPFQNQDNIPIFDSILQRFNVDSLFRTNRFSGTDRIGDANQVSLALTTRFINANTGEEKAKASIGEVIYFRDRRVTVCSTPGCIASEDPSAEETLSPLAGQVSYALTRTWSTQANIAWDFNNNQAENGNINFHFEPSDQKILNIGYNFVRNGDVLFSDQNGDPTDASTNNLNQPYVSVAWPLLRQWTGVGAYRYNLSHDHLQTYFFGAEYDSCCWAVRALYGRTFTSLNQRQNPVFDNFFTIQFQLKGLANLGNSDPGDLLTSTIQGYKDPYDV